MAANLFKSPRKARWSRYVSRGLFLLTAALLAAVNLTSAGSADTRAAAAATLAFTQPCGNPGTPGQIRHVVWIWMENESYGNVIGNSAAPYQTSLARQCGVAANFHNESHGSLENYIAATDGQNILGTSFINDCLPNPAANYCVSPGPSIFSQTEAAGETWRGYAEDMPSNCYQGNTANYAARHNPAVYYSTLSSCGQYDIPMGSAATQTGAFYTDLENGSLPSFSFISPNLVDDAHGTVSAGDSWLGQIIPLIVNGPNYQNGDTVIFITNDEGCAGTCGPDYAVNEDCTSQALDTSQPSCHIPTIVVGPYTPAGTVDNTFYTHYSMLRTSEELLGLPLLGLAASANSMAAGFGLTPPSSTVSPPGAPANLTATVNGTGGVNLSWTAASPGTAAIAGYQVTRNGTVMATTGTGTTYTDTSASPGTTYRYAVAAVDALGNIGAASNTATVSTASANLLANPGFEAWSNGSPAGWSAYGPATTFTRSSDAHSGSSSVLVATTYAGYAASGLNDGTTPTINSTTVGITYTGSCWVKASKSITINVQFHEWKHNWTAVSAPAVSSLTVSSMTNWYQLQVSDAAAGSGDMLPFSVYSTNTRGGGATFEVDDCSVSASASG